MIMSKMKTQNNKGVTLIELIVVVALLSIMVATVILGVGLVNSGNSQKAAKLINTYLNDVRSNTLSIENDWSARIQKKSDKYYLVSKKDDVAMEEKNLGGRVNITYNNGSGEKNIENGNELVIKFSKATGRVKSITYGAIDAAESTLTDIKGTNSEESIGITVTGKSGNDQILNIWYETGKVTDK